MKKLIFLLLLLPTVIFSQNTWVNFKVQFDYYAPSESNFFMVETGTGTQVFYHQPTTPYEYIDTIIFVMKTYKIKNGNKLI